MITTILFYKIKRGGGKRGKRERERERERKVTTNKHTDTNLIRIVISLVTVVYEPAIFAGDF